MNYDETKNTSAELNQRASQSENFITFEHLVDQAHADANIFSCSNENDEDNVSSSQYTERTDNDISPDRNYVSRVHNLANKSMKFQDYIIPETPDIADIDEDEENICQTTFTQYINQKAESDSQNFSSDKSTYRSPKDALIIVTTKYKSPSSERISQSMALYGIPKCRADQPFFSNMLDLVKQKESLNTNTSYFDVPAFKSNIEEITSIKLWRRMKVNEFYPSGSSIKTCHLKRTLAGYNLLTIKPLTAPPSSKDIKKWIRTKKYLSEKDYDVKLQKNIHNSPINTINVDKKSQSETSNCSVSNNLKNYRDN